MNFLKQLVPQYRDYRFWIIQSFTIASSAIMGMKIHNYRTAVNLNDSLQSSGPIQLYVLAFLVATLTSAILLGPKATIATIIVAAIFFLPDGILLARANYGQIILIRLGVLSLLSVATSLLAEREKRARRHLLDLNRRLNENILEKKRYIKLAGEAQENERRRISRDLHDDSLQLLAAATMDINQAIGFESPEKIRKNMIRAKETITLTSETIRRYCEELRPILLESIGLIAAVEWLGKDLESRSTLNVTFETLGEGGHLDPEGEIHLFRVIQEAFHNIERHSGATAVEFLWEYLPDRVVISVTDNGVGMWTAGPAPTRSLGIQGMHERIDLLGGTISFESRPGFGTRILVTIPTI